MKVTAHRDRLLAACKVANAATGRSRQIKPILSCLLLSATDNTCTVSATDLEVGVRIDVDGTEVSDAGDVVIEAEQLTAILDELPDDQVSLETDKDICFVSGTASEFKLPIGDATLFPTIPAFTDDKYHEVAAGNLKEMIRRVEFAVADVEHSKFGATCGILWEMVGDKMSMIATDGKQLALVHGIAITTGEHTTKGKMSVVPTRATTLLKRNLIDPDELVKISFRTNEVLMKTSRATIYSRLVEGRFPDYKRIFPSSHKSKAKIAAGALAAVIRQAAIVTSDESRRVDFAFAANSLAANSLTLSIKGATGEAKTSTPIQLDGSPVTVTLDPRHAGGMAGVLAAETEVVVELVDDATPVVLRAGDGYACLVVTMKREGTKS